MPTPQVIYLSDYSPTSSADAFKNALNAAITADKPLIVDCTPITQNPYSKTNLTSSNHVRIRGTDAAFTVRFAATSGVEQAILLRCINLSTNTTTTKFADSSWNYDEFMADFYIDNPGTPPFINPSPNASLAYMQPYKITSVLAEDAYPNTYRIKVPDLSAFTIGKAVRLRSHRLIEGQSRNAFTHGETNMIVGKDETGPGSAGYLILELPLRDAYSAESSKWSFTIASYTLVSDSYPSAAKVVTSVTFSDAGAASVDPREIRGCRITTGSQSHYIKSYDPLTKTAYFETHDEYRATWDLTTSLTGTTAVIDALTYVSTNEAPRIDISDITFAGPTFDTEPSSTTTRGLEIYGARQVRLENVTMFDVYEDGYHLEFCTKAKIINCQDSGEHGIGAHCVSLTGCNDVECVGLSQYNSWQPFDINGDFYSHMVRLTNCTFVGGYSSALAPWPVLEVNEGEEPDESIEETDGISTHGPVLDLVYDNCLIDNYTEMALIRGVRTTIRNCKMYSKQYFLRSMYLYGGYSLRIENCEITDRVFRETWPVNALDATNHRPLVFVDNSEWWGDLYIDGLRGEIRGPLVRIGGENNVLPNSKHVRGAIDIRNLTGLTIRSSIDTDLITSDFIPTFERGIYVDVAPGDVNTIGGGALQVNPVYARKIRANYLVAATPNIPDQTYIKGRTWRTQTSTVPGRGICWAAEFGLFVKVGNGASWSADGKTWTAGTGVPGNTWNSVAWSPELGIFVAVASSSSNRLMTSTDGKAWSAGTPAADSNWRSVCWSPELGLFCAAASTGNKIMISTTGTSWRSVNANLGINLYGICWSPERNLFVAVANTGSGKRVQTSPNGVDWTLQSTPYDNEWKSVCWSPWLNLFVAAATTTTGTSPVNSIMTSPDGITWTARTPVANNEWTSITWSPELGLLVAVSDNGTNRVMASADGINWASMTFSGTSSGWACVTWSPQLGIFVAGSAASSDNVMTLEGKPTGWAAATGTASRATFATSTATTADVAERLKGLLDDLLARGVISA